MKKEQKDWDAIGKALTHAASQAVLNLFVPGAKFLRMEQGELQIIVINKDGKPEIIQKRVDNLMWADIRGREVLVLIEFQTYCV